MHHSPFWEGNSTSAKQEFPPVVYSRVHKIPPRFYVRNKAILFHTDFIRVSYTLILSFNVRLGFPRDLFLRILKPETCTHFLISNFRRVLYVVCFLLGNYPASGVYMPTFRNTLFHLIGR